MQLIQRLISEPWSPEDDARLRQLAELRLSPPVIAVRLDRTAETVMQRAWQLGVRLAPATSARR